MSYLEGVGDEVVGLLVSFLAMTVVALLWKTTQVRDSPPIHSVVITADRIRAYGFPAGNNSRGHSHHHTHQHEEQTEPPGGEGNVTEQEDVSEEESNETPPPDVTAEDSVNIKLKFLDETELDVTTKLSECLKKFRKRHLDTHLSLSPTDKVKLIFNGKIIHRDAQKLSEAGIYDNCTVHCLVQRVSPADGGGAEGATSAGAAPQSAHPGGQTGNPLNDVGSDLDLQTLCFPLLGTILFGCWWFALFYSQNFTMLSLTSLVSLTVLYAASVANLMFY